MKKWRGTTVRPAAHGQLLFHNGIDAFTHGMNLVGDRDEHPGAVAPGGTPPPDGERRRTGIHGLILETREQRLLEAPEAGNGPTEREAHGRSYQYYRGV